MKELLARIVAAAWLLAVAVPASAAVKVSDHSKLAALLDSATQAPAAKFLHRGDASPLGGLDVVACLRGKRIRVVFNNDDVRVVTHRSCKAAGNPTETLVWFYTGEVVDGDAGQARAALDAFTAYLRN